MVVNFYKKNNFEITETTFADLLKIYFEKQPIPQGRGTSKVVEYKGEKYILKKEKRGGFLSFLLKEEFLSLKGFFKEVEISKIMEENKLTIPILLRFAIKYKMLWQIYTLTPYIENCVSLKEVVLKDCIDKKKIISSGEKIARMHKIGIFHSDLNLGNIIFDKQEVYLIDFKNSYIYDSPLNKLLCKKNLIRLLRSYIKERMRAKKKAEEDFLQFLIEGYSSVIKEDWVKRISFENFSVKLHALSYKIRF